MRSAPAPTAKNHPAEAHRRDKRDLLLQCERCGAKGTMYARDGIRALPTYDARQAAMNATWRRCQAATARGDEPEAQRLLFVLRDLRYGRPAVAHRGCGGPVKAYDIGEAADAQA